MRHYRSTVGGKFGIREEAAKLKYPKLIFNNDLDSLTFGEWAQGRIDGEVCNDYKITAEKA